MKRKINVNRSPISSEEINKHKNFDSVLKTHLKTSKPFFKKPLFLSSVLVATVAVVATFVLLNTNKTKIDKPQISTTDDSVALEKFYKTEEAKPCVNPPIEGLNVPYTVYKINAEKLTTLDFKTGSKLIIPKNVFVDENDKPLKGEVELRYREFHNPVEFFVSGIPMTYDSAGNRYHFESAGMMEMLAYQNGKQVNMANGKSINVELASEYKTTDYNLYKLDTVKNNWSCLGKDKVVENKANSFIEKPIDKIENTIEFKKIETAKVEAEKEKELKIADLPKPLPETKKPIQSRKEKYTFNIDVDEKQFPELAVYKNVLFEVGDENKNFSTAMYGIVWDEAKIKEGTRKGENYLLTLMKSSKKYEVIVYPVYEGKNYELAMKNYQEKFAKYNSISEKRKVDEQKIEQDFQAKIAMLKKQQETLEREWIAQENNNFKLMSNEEKVMRVFAINSFGVYNCDKPSVYPKGILCSAVLTNEKNIKIWCYDVFLVDKSRNGLFTYNKNPIAQFSYNPSVSNLLWTVDENGALYYLSPDEFKNIKTANGMQTFQLKKVEQKFKTIEEMKTFFNL